MTRRRKDSGFGARLQSLRKQTGLTQTEVARRMDSDPAAISKLEAGLNDLKISTILRYCDAIGARIHIGLVDQAHTEPSEKGA
jgi:transcriptional regulator with XRE-family HTH domain